MKQPFIPDTLPLSNLNLGGMITEIGKANREIAAFGGRWSIEVIPIRLGIRISI